MIKLLGLLGGACFAYCGVPAAWATCKVGRSVGTPISTAWMITVGGIAMYAYLLGSFGFDLILLVNYTVEVGSWGLVVWYHYFPRVAASQSRKESSEQL